MNTTEYKGFNIHQLGNGRFAPQNKGDAVFNPDGYATLNNAKGAITKHLQAKEADAARELPAPPAEVSVPLDIAPPVLRTTTPPGFANIVEKWMNEGTKLSKSIIAQVLGFDAAQRASLMACHVPAVSRNKREGSKGKRRLNMWFAKPLNRKGRKQWKLVERGTSRDIVRNDAKGGN